MAEVDQQPIAQVLGDMAREVFNYLCRGLLVGADDGAQLFGVKAFGQYRRAHKIAEHHRQMAAFAFCGCGGGGGGGGRDGRGANRFDLGNSRSETIWGGTAEIQRNIVMLEGFGILG